MSGVRSALLIVREPFIQITRAAASDRVMRERDEKSDLRAAIDALTLENAGLNASLQELRELQSLIGFEPPGAPRIIPARTLGMSLDPERRVMFIDRGADHGITIGAPVVTSNHWLLGTVQEVSARAAVVRLAVDDQSSLPASLITDTRVPLLAAGAYGLGVLLDLVPPHLPIEPGTLVITAGLDPRIPRGIIIGKVGRALRSSNDPFRTFALDVAPELGTLPQIVGVIQPR